MKRKNPILACNIAIVLLEVIGLIYSIMEYGWGMFRFYTQDSNLFAMITCVALIDCLLREKEVPNWLVKARYVAVLSLVITFIVTATVLAPLYGRDYFVMFTEGSKLYQHLLCPILYFVSFFALERRVPKEKTCIYSGMLPTLVYAAVFVVLNLLRVVEGPYPFLKVYDQPIYMSFIWGVVILGGGLLMAWGVWKLGTLSARSGGKKNSPAVQ